MDKIMIKDLEVYGNVGVYEEEKKLGQKFLISVEIDTSFKDCIKDDSIRETINYGEVSNFVYEKFKSNKYNLLEKSADELCKLILIKYERAKSVKVEIKKPWAPIGLSLDYASISTFRRKNKAYIALGSNMGDKENNLNLALKKIEDDCTIIKKVSSFITTKPVGYLNQDDFLNGVCKVETILEPHELLEKLLSIELELKRERLIKWGPRTMDLDLIMFNDYIINDEDLVVPHPRMEERLFVLDPLCEIAPYEVHPVLNMRIVEIKNRLS